MISTAYLHVIHMYTAFLHVYALTEGYVELGAHPVTHYVYVCMYVCAVHVTTMLYSTQYAMLQLTFYSNQLQEK